MKELIMKKKEINDIIIFMKNNNLDYRNIELLSNFCIFINKDYLSSNNLKSYIRNFDKKIEILSSTRYQTALNNSLNSGLVELLGLIDTNLTNSSILINLQNEEEEENLEEEDYEDYDNEVYEDDEEENYNNIFL